MAILAMAIGLHVILLEIAGYVVAATLCFWGVAFAFGSRKYLKDLGISLAFAGIVYFSFTKGLNINLPSGFFEGMLGK
jgi:putative tricarboxylic transport membrane protein